MYKNVKRERDHALKRARAMRDQALVIAMKRKEEYLGARVPKELKERVIAKANELGIPISILIRRVLEEAFGGDSLFVSSEAKPPTPVSHSTPIAENFPEVIGWNAVELNVERVCDGCGMPIRPRDSASLGYTLSGSEFVIICSACKGKL